MPFGYFGSKHGLARFYPEPQYSLVIEPFAGSAAYACYWALQGKVKHAILVDANPNVIALWRRLQKMTIDELRAIPAPIKGERTTEPLIAAASGEQGAAVLAGKSRQITDRMVKSWPRLRDRIEKALPYLKTWDVLCAEYTILKPKKATWFIDPPYCSKAGSRTAEGKRSTVNMGTAGAAGAGGDRYTEHGVGFKNHGDLGRWCQTRRGQIIVCEQMPADWLPFIAFRNQRNGVGAGTQSTRTEAIWVKP